MNNGNTASSMLSRLAKEYQLQAKDLTSVPIIIRVDDRDGDCDIYLGFCKMYLRMSDAQSDEFVLTLDNVPFDDDVKAAAGELDGSWQPSRTGERLTLNLSASDSTGIRQLAKAIRQVVGRGRRYLDPNWKWIAPRTAKSLERLAKALPKSRRG